MLHHPACVIYTPGTFLYQHGQYLLADGMKKAMQIHMAKPTPQETSQKQTQKRPTPTSIATKGFTPVIGQWRGCPRSKTCIRYPMHTGHCSQGQYLIKQQGSSKKKMPPSASADAKEAKPKRDEAAAMGEGSSIPQWDMPATAADTSTDLAPSTAAADTSPKLTTNDSQILSPSVGVCEVCGSDAGIPLPCSVRGCRSYIHAQCALDTDRRMLSVVHIGVQRYSIFCAKHSASSQVAEFPSNFSPLASLQHDQSFDEGDLVQKPTGRNGTRGKLAEEAASRISRLEAAAESNQPVTYTSSHESRRTKIMRLQKPGLDPRPPSHEFFCFQPSDDESMIDDDAHGMVGLPPRGHARMYEEGIERAGASGQMWRVVADSRGGVRWVPVSQLPVRSGATPGKQSDVTLAEKDSAAENKPKKEPTKLFENDTQDETADTDKLKSVIASTPRGSLEYESRFVDDVLGAGAVERGWRIIDVRGGQNSERVLVYATPKGVNYTSLQWAKEERELEDAEEREELEASRLPRVRLIMSRGGAPTPTPTGVESDSPS